MSLAPVILFVFNRPEHTKKTLASLKKDVLARDSELFIFSDGPRNDADLDSVNSVRDIIDSLDGFHSISITKKDRNQGLANSVIAGVSEVMKRSGKVIVIEDDLQFSPHFLSYMNEALEVNAKDPKVFSIGGWSPPIEVPPTYTADSYLSYRCCTWGWASWQDRWERVDWQVKDFDQFVNNPEEIAQFNRGGDDMTPILKMQLAGQVNSWGIRWDYAHFRNKAFCFRPAYSIVGNTGNDGSGVHCGATNHYDVSINTSSKFTFPKPGEIQVNDELNRRFATFYDGRQRSESVADVTPFPARPLWRRVLARCKRSIFS